MNIQWCSLWIFKYITESFYYYTWIFIMSSHEYSICSLWIFKYITESLYLYYTTFHEWIVIMTSSHEYSNTLATSPPISSSHLRLAALYTNLHKFFTILQIFSFSQHRKIYIFIIDLKKYFKYTLYYKYTIFVGGTLRISIFIHSL